MSYGEGQANVTLVIPQKYLDMLKKHAEKGTGPNMPELDALVSSGCIDYRLNFQKKNSQA